MLRIEQLQTKYRLPNGRTVGVHNVNLELGKGEFYTLLGPSGCGKTTTLRSVAGFERPVSGEIAIGDQIVFSSALNKIVPTHKRRLGMVFQSYAIWPHMTVFDNIAYPLRYGVGVSFSSAEIKKRVQQTLSLLRLHDVEDKPAPQLSGGQQQRVALARALIQEPKLLLLDEPLSNLDAALREVLRVEIKQLLQSMNITALYVTHDRLEALSMADRIGVMSDGLIVQEGSPWNLYTSPETSFVASFLGSVNCLPGIVKTEAPAQHAVDTPIGQFKCVIPTDRAAEGRQVLVIVRPERINLVKPSAVPDPARNVFTGQIENLVFLGESFDCQVRVQDTVLRATLPWTERFEVGETVKVAIPIDGCIVVPR